MKKAILIKDSNKDLIQAAIKEVEGKATARTIDYTDITDALTKIEKRLNIPKKAMTGITVYLDVNAQDMPRAYKYPAYSTQAVIYRTAAAWRLEELNRTYVCRAGYGIQIDLTPDAEQAIRSKYTHF